MMADRMTGLNRMNGGGRELVGGGWRRSREVAVGRREVVGKEVKTGRRGRGQVEGEEDRREVDTKR